jgi:hypothetical protein
VVTILLSDNIRRYQPGEEEKISKFLSQIFKDWPNTSISDKKAFWQWKYLENPLNKNTILVVENEGDIIACTHGYYREIKIANMNCKLQVDSDMAIHPDFRGKGLYSKLVQEKVNTLKDDGSDISIWVTINPKVIHQGKKLGYDSFPLNQMIKIKNTKTLPIHKRIGYKAIEFINMRNRPKLKTAEFEIEQITMFGDEVTDFWTRISIHYNFITKRDKETLNWRYFDSRGGEYRTIIIRKEESMIGYIVTKIVVQRDGSKNGIIVDMLVEPNEPGAAFKLINKATGDLMDQVNLVKYLVIKGHPFEEMFKMCGFLSKPSEVHIGYRVDNQRVADIVGNLHNYSRELLHIQYGDTDFV